MPTKKPAGSAARKSKTTAAKGAAGPSRGAPEALPGVSAALEEFAAEGLDEGSGAAALGRLQGLLDKQPAAPGRAPSFNPRMAASAALALVQAVDELRLRPRLKPLAALGEFEAVQLDRLPDLARASWYLSHQVDRAAALSSSAQVPESLATQGQVTRARMLKVLSFHFEDDAQIGPELVLIRRGLGYQDLADDLAALARLYKENRALLKDGTPRHYLAADETDAARLAAQIVAELGRSLAPGTGRETAALLARVATLLLAAYDEVAAAGRYLCRKQPEAVRRFPNLFTVARSRPRRSPAEPAGPGEPTEPASG